MLPSLSYATSEQQEITGEDLLLAGHKEVAGKAIDKEKSYLWQAPVYNEANHYRRMKRAFEALGVDGIKNYLKPFVKEWETVCKSIDIIFPTGK